MEKITVEAIINAPIKKVWEYWTEPKHITKWNNASEDWHSPSSVNNLVEGGTFVTRMESKDGTVGFDFGGTYTNIVQNEKISYVMEDGRKVDVEFNVNENGVRVVEVFDPENENPADLQKAGWQAILDNFKKYVESN